jgi:ketosteroid isomerase-like protein
MTTTNETVVMDAIRAVEERDRTRLAALYHPEVKFGWPAGLPYGGWHSGAAVVAMSVQFASIWDRLQPTDAERRMDPQLVASDGDTVVVEYQWRGRDPEGRRFETPTLARYELREGLLARAQMYHFDMPGLLAFLAQAGEGGGPA